MDGTKQHILSLLVENHPGVLARVAGHLSGRGFNIDSLAVGETRDPQFSRMTIVLSGDDRVLEQCNKQLNRLVEVVKINDFSNVPDFIDRELILVKVDTGRTGRRDIMELAEIFRARIVDTSPKSLTVELTGTPDKINAFLDLVKPFGIKELVRTGRIAMARGGQGFTE
ncbi:acetolactate synthase small subunit [bacterium]|nr:acetolactate synthase small subunit [bacterium]